MLKTINFQQLKSDQLLTFGSRTTGLFTGFDPEKDTYALKPFVTKATKAFTGFSKAYERDLKNPFTKKIDNSDHLRDGAFYYFRDYVNSSVHSEDADEREAAQRVIDVIEKHGWQAANFGNKAETSAFIKMIAEIKDYHMADLELLSATTRFDKWVNRANEFEELQKASDTQPPSGLPTLVQTKPVLVDALRKLITMVDNQFTENSTDAQLAGYVDSINNIITEAMTVARAAATRDENKKKNPATGDKPVA